MEIILCPTDFSPSSVNAIRYADELAQRMNSRIVLFHNIYESAGRESAATGALPGGKPARDPKYHQEQKQKLDALRKSLEDVEWGIPVSYEEKIGYGLPGETIPQLAHQERADLVVVGYERPEGMKEAFFGSVTADVIKKSPCPVLFVPRQAVFKPIYKIVFATDLHGEPYTDVAFVSKLAGLFEAEILFLHVLAEALPDNQQLAQEELERLHKSLPYKNVSFHTEASAHLEEGISQFCHRHKANLLVMGYHPRNFWEHMFSQDYSLEMAYHTYLPLLIIHYRQ